MSRADKLFAAMRANPAADWTIADVERLCRTFGITCEPPSNGSHYSLKHPRVSGRLYRHDRGIGVTVDPHQYRVFVEPLSAGLGGGFVAYAPGLTGCISDGGSPDEALANVYDAVRCWIDAAMRAGEVVPAPDALRRVA